MNNTNQSSSGYPITLTIWLTVPPLLVVIGTFGHVLTIVVLTQRRNRNNSIARYLIALAVADLIALWTGCLRKWILYMYDVDVRNLSTIVCKLHLYLTCFASQSSSMLIVIVTLERLVGVWLPLKRKRTCTPGTALAVITTFAAVIGFLNSHLLYGLVITKDRKCVPKDGAYVYFFLNVFTKLYFVITFIIPFIILFLANSAIICRVHKKRINNRAVIQQPNAVSLYSKNASMTAMLITLNVVFIVCVAPVACFLPFYKKLTIPSADYRNNALELVWAIVNMMLYTNNTVNFVLYFLSGDRFRREVKLLLSSCLKSMKLWSNRSRQVAPAIEMS